MNRTHPAGCAAGAIHSESRYPAARSLSDWLYLAAAPTFAIMALLTGVLGGGQPDILCSTAEHSSPLGGMTETNTTSVGDRGARNLSSQPEASTNDPRSHLR